MLLSLLDTEAFVRLESLCKTNVDIYFYVSSFRIDKKCEDIGLDHRKISEMLIYQSLIYP
jgi:hypothetical protein